MPLTTTTDGIIVADKMIALADHEKELIDMATAKLTDSRTPTTALPEIRQILASSSDCYRVYRNWRAFGRHTINVNPDLYHELTLTESSKIPGEVLWALPYRNPMIVYPHRPTVDLGEYGKRNILGFYLSGLDSMEPMPLARPREYEAAADTHDRSTTALRMTIYTEVLDDNTVAPVDYETFYYSIPRTGNDTFGALCDQISNRLVRYGGARPRLGDGATMTDPAQLQQMLAPLLATVFYLCSTTVDAEPVPASRLKRRNNKQRKTIRLINVGWHIGPTLSALRRKAIATEPRDLGGVDRQQRPHQRRCHFAVRWTGPGRTVARTVFIAPTWIHPELLDVDTSTTLNNTPNSSKPQGKQSP